MLKDHGFQGWLPRFIHAILTDDRDLIRSILDVGESFAVQDRDGISALTYACLRGDQSVVNALLQQRSVDVNAVDVLGRTALFWLVMVAPYTSYDPSDIAQLLLHHGASADIVDMEGRSVVDLVRSQYGDRSGILQILRRVHFDVPTKEVIMDGEVDRTTMEKLLEADGQCSICHEEISCCSVGKSDSQHSGRRVPSDEANQPSLVDCMRHAYHQRCIRRWLDTRQHHTDTPCPMCRAPITTIFKVSSDDDAFREVAAASE